MYQTMGNTVDGGGLVITLQGTFKYKTVVKNGQVYLFN